jgi:hypothetical protein
VGRGFKGTNFLSVEFFHRKNSESETCFPKESTFHSGMDAAALKAVKGTAGAGNAKGVFYDN